MVTSETESSPRQRAPNSQYPRQVIYQRDMSLTILRRNESKSLTTGTPQSMPCTLQKQWITRNCLRYNSVFNESNLLYKHGSRIINITQQLVPVEQFIHFWLVKKHVWKILAQPHSDFAATNLSTFDVLQLLYDVMITCGTRAYGWIRAVGISSTSPKTHVS